MDLEQTSKNLGKNLLCREHRKARARGLVATGLLCTTILAGLGGAEAALVPCDPTTVDINPEDTMTCAGAYDLGAGLTSVLNGTLFIDGLLTNSGTSVAATGNLGGSGIINSDVDVAGRLIASPGDLTINGNLTFQSGSSLAVTLGGGTSTKIDVSGNTVINDDVDVVLSGDLTQDTVTTILTSGGLVHGSFNKVYDESGNQLFFAAISEPNEVGLMKVATVGTSQVMTQAAGGLNLDAHRGLMNTIHARIDHRYRESARLGTPRKARYADLEEATFGFAGSSTGALMNSQLDDPYARLWPSALNGGLESGTHVPQFTLDMMRENRSKADNMRMAANAVPRLQISTNYGGMWFEGFGVASKQMEQAGAVTGYKGTAGGFSVGLDSHAAKNWIFGGMVGYGVSEAELDHNAGQVEGDTVYTGIYMANISTTHFANLFLTAAMTNFEAEREVKDGLNLGTASDDFGSYMWDARLELGRTFGFLEDDFIRPNVAIEYVSVFQDDYIDDGAGIVPGITVEDHTVRMVRSEAQVDMLFGSQSFEDDGWSARVFVGVAHEIFLDDRIADVYLSGFSNPIELGLGEDHRTFGMLGASISFAVNQRLRTQISYQGESNTDFERHNVVAGFSVAW